MDNFREGLKYNPNERNKRQIKGRTSTRNNKRYNAKKVVRIRIMALMLAGTLALSAGGIKKAVDNHEQKYVSNFEEITDYNMKSQDFQISPELFERVEAFANEIDELEENSFSGISNLELADYYKELSDLYLDVLKGKVSTITGMDTKDFTLVAPTAHGTEVTGTQIKDPEMMYGLMNIKSKEIDNYMNKILDLRNIRYEILNSDVDRDKLEKELIDARDTLGGVVSINLLRELQRNGMTNLSSYRIETKDLNTNGNVERLVADIEK